MTELSPRKNILDVVNLSKSYGSQGVLRDISFSIAEGEVFGLLGKNGAGKTTLISCINSLEPFDQGEVTLFGEKVEANPEITNRHLGCVPQELVNFSFLSVRNAITSFAYVYGIKPDWEWIDYLIRTLELTPFLDRYSKILSGGYKKRLAICRALLHKPKLLILDEPTAGVDLELRQSMYEFIATLKKEKIAILYTTHYLEEAEVLCDRIAFLGDGHIKKIGTKSEVLQNSSKILELILHQEASQAPDGFSLSVNRRILRTELRDGKNPMECICALPFDTALISDIRIQEPSIEDVFQKVLK